MSLRNYHIHLSARINHAKILPKFFICIFEDFKSNNSTFQWFTLLVMMDCIDCFLTNCDSIAVLIVVIEILLLIIISFCLQDLSREENDTHWANAKVSAREIIKISLSMKINPCEI